MICIRGLIASFLNKDKPEEKEENQDKPKAPEAKKTTVTTTETINLPKPVEENTDKEILDELEILPATKEFAKIPSDNLSKAAEFLIKHPSICTEQQKDALIMTAFDLQLENKSDEANILSTNHYYYNTLANYQVTVKQHQLM